jgi:branched-chain amino acid transport system substrate-binding protein
MKLAMLLVLIASMILVSACGQGSTQTSSGGNEKETKGESSDATSQLTENVKIGVILPYSGVYAKLGESITKGMELYLEEINWEVEGKKIELIKEDTEANPQTALRKVRKLIEQDKVQFLSGPVSTAVAYAIRDDVDKNKIPLIVSNAGGDDLTRSKKSDYIWRVSFNSWQIGTAMGQWAYDNVSKEVYVTAADYAFGHEISESFKAAFTAKGGKIIGEVYPPLGSNDYSSYLTQIKSANPKAVYSFFAGSDAVRFVKQYEEYGLKGNIPLLGSGWLTAENIRPALAQSPVGIKAAMYWDYHLDSDQNKTFVEAYEKKYNERPSADAVSGYDSARVIVEALTKTKGDTNSENIVKALKEVEFVSPRGPIKFDPVTHNIIQNVYITETELKDGKTENKVIGTLEAVQDPGQ